MNETGRKAIFVVIAIEILALVLFIKENLIDESIVSEIKRPAANQMETYSTLSLQTENGKEDISIIVKPKSYTEREVQDLVEKAKLEIDGSVFGNNVDADHISDDLVLKSSYVDDKVSASWSFDNMELIDTTGKINLKALLEPSVVTAFCSIKVSDYEEVYSFPMRLVPADISTTKGFRFLLEEAIDKENEKTKNGTFVLPTTLYGMKLSWEKKKSNSWILLLVFGLIVGPLVIIGGKEDEKKREKERQKMLDRDYPEIVSSLSLYIGAGVNIKGALQRIGDSYKNQVSSEQDKRPGYEGILQLIRQMADGAGELESIQSFGKRMRNKSYRKLALLLSQNLRKGSSALVESLEKEEQSAFEERKLRAKIAGEEASTKLLLPMMGLLGIVVVVLVFPAFIGMGM